MPLVMGTPIQGGYFGSLEFGFDQIARLRDRPPIVGSLDFLGDLETGSLSARGADPDGLVLYTHTTSGGTSVIASGGAGPSASLRTKVVSTDADGKIPNPRKGQFFLRGKLVKGDNHVPRNNKARMNLNLEGGGSRVLYLDPNTGNPAEHWWSFSLYIPADWENEGVNGTSGQLIISQIQHNFGGGGHHGIQIRSSSGVPNWDLQWRIDPNGAYGSTGQRHDTLAALEPYKGQWNTFVFNTIINPFSTPTNPKNVHPEGVDFLYPANTGKLRVWINDELLFNRVNAPVGHVPSTRNNLFSLNMYKPNWVDGEGPNSTTTGPIYMGLDEIRIAYVSDGGSYALVHPDGFSEP